jgi:hypothetical protein
VMGVSRYDHSCQSSHDASVPGPPGRVNRKMVLCPPITARWAVLYGWAFLSPEKSHSPYHDEDAIIRWRAFS